MFLAPSTLFHIPRFAHPSGSIKFFCGFALLLLLTACGGGGSANSPAPDIQVGLGPSTRVAVIKSDGSLWSWGDYRIGDGSENAVTAPKQIGAGYKSVAVGYSFTVGVKEDGSLWSWGTNGSGALGNGSFAPELSPFQVGSSYRKVVVGNSSSPNGNSVIALKADGGIWIWGGGTSDPSIPFSGRTPRLIASGFSDIAAGANGRAYGIKPDASLWQWAQADVDPKFEPFVPAKIGDNFKLVSAGADFAVGIKNDGALWGWGKSASGQLGFLNAAESAPVSLGAGFKSVSAGISYTLALKPDRSVWVAGANDGGQLGDGTTQASYAFKQIGTDFIQVWAGDRCSMGQKSDKTLWAWGSCMFSDSVSSSLVPRQINIP